MEVQGAGITCQDSLSLHAGRPTCPGTVCLSSMQGQNGRSSRTIIPETPFPGPYQKSAIKTDLLSQEGYSERTRCPSIEAGRFPVFPHMIERKKKTILSVLHAKRRKNGSGSVLFRTIGDKKETIRSCPFPHFGPIPTRALSRRGISALWKTGSSVCR